MPDRDWYTRNRRPNWRGVARRIKAGDGPERVGDLALAALTQTIRDAGGVPGLGECVEVVRSFTAGATIPQSFADLRNVSLSVGGSDLARIAAVAAEATIVSLERGEVIPDLAREVERRFLDRALESFLFAPSRQRHVGSRFGTLQEAHDWQRQCLDLMAPRLAKLAEGIERHPSGAGLRTPQRLHFLLAAATVAPGERSRGGR